MNKVILTSIAGMLAGFSISAFAHDCTTKTGDMGHDKSHYDKSMGMRAMVDLNKDGNISRDEAMSFHTQMFAKMDLNGDGMVDADEQNKMRDSMRDMKHKMKHE